MNDLSFNQVANIKVFGVGGGGCNAVNRMVSEGVKGVEFYVANTDLQILNISPVENKLVLGREITKGLGAGGDPEMGKRAAQESEQEIREAIKGLSLIHIYVCQRSRFFYDISRSLDFSSCICKHSADPMFHKDGSG